MRETSMHHGKIDSLESPDVKEFSDLDLGFLTTIPPFIWNVENVKTEFVDMFDLQRIDVSDIDGYPMTKGDVSEPFRLTVVMRWRAF